MVKNIVEHQFNITKHERKKLNKHQSFLIWFTGLSGSGKSTIANALEIELYKQGISTYLLDGDNIRFGINKDLSFSPEDRTENIRRIAEVANLFIDAGVVTLASFVSPYKIDRENIKSIVGQENFVEIYVSTSLEECERRDVKGLYQKARKGEIPNMTGISSPYEPPEAPSLIVDTEKESVKKSVNRILELIKLKLNG